jgi:acyl carrier protein
MSRDREVAESNSLLTRKYQDELIKIWRTELLLGVADPNADFLEIDGSSLSAVRIVAQIKEKLGKMLPFSVLYDYPTPAALAPILLTLNGDSHGEFL